MKFLKYFESEKQFREVDLTELFNGYIKYKYTQNLPYSWNSDEYFWRHDYKKMSDDFNKNVLSPLLVDKEIEFPKVIHPYDGESTYSFSGRVKDIRVDKKEDISFIVYLYDEKNALYLFKIPRYSKLETNIVKIYNSEPIDIEDEINMFLNVTKYNL